MSTPLSVTRLLGLGLTPGKLRGLQRISNANGTLTMVALDDQVIAPDVQRSFAARLGVEPVEVPGSHDCIISRPDAVAAVLSGLVP